MSGNHPHGSDLRFPFQDDDSEDELFVPFSSMSLDPHLEENPIVSSGVESFDFSVAQGASDDEAGPVPMGPSRPPVPSIMSTLFPDRGSRDSTYQRTRDSLVDIVTRLMHLERIAGQYGSVPISVTTHTQPAPFDESPYPNQPANWETHHEYFLWPCRGTVSTITDHLQAIFQFSPPLEKPFVRAKLNSHNALRQFEFLQAYLPGESHSMQRAEARIVLWEADLSDPDALEGRQHMDIPQFSPTDDRYEKPRMPRGRPPFTEWVHIHDSYLLLFLGHHPHVFLRQCRWMFDCQPTDHFVSIRMAQLPFLGVSAEDISEALVTLKRFGSQAAAVEGVLVI